MSKLIKISPDLTLPLDVVTQTLGVLAKRRAGKSYLASKIVELLWAARQQVVILDPKGDWWGLRSSADGRSEGIPILIVGGEHGDIKLEANAGEVIARMVVEERISVLIDLSELRKHEVATFCAMFLETLYRLKAKEIYRTAMMLIIDEADAVAPQHPQKGEERMLGAAEDIVRRGGQRGIGCLMATQRAAVLNKNVLTQIQILVVLRMIAPQDLKAMLEWINVHGTPEQRKELMESLAALPTGTGWFWSPGWPTEEGIFQRVKVGRRQTFDSGATPKPGETRIQPKALADIDLATVKKRMAATIEKAKQEDPRELRKQIMELQRQLATKRPTVPAAAAPAPTKTIEKRVEVPVLKDAQVVRLEKLASSIGKLGERLKVQAMEIIRTITVSKRETERHTEIKRLMRHQERPIKAEVAAREKAVQRLVAVEDGDDSINQLDKGARAALIVLAQHQSGCAAGRLALLAGYRLSGGFRNSLSSLRTRNLIAGGNTEVMKITDDGLKALGEWPALPEGREFVDYWLKHRSLGSCERKVLSVLLDSQLGMTINDLAAAAGYGVSGGFRNALSTLRTAGLLVGKNNATMEACDELLEASRA